VKRFEAMHFPVGRAIPRVGEKALPTLTLPVDGEGIASLSGLFANGSGIGPSTARGGRRREVGEHVSTPPKPAGCAKPAVDIWEGERLGHARAAFALDPDRNDPQGPVNLRDLDLAARAILKQCFKYDRRSLRPLP